MLQTIWSQILSSCYCKVCDLLSIMQVSYSSIPGAIHTLSFTDAAQVTKHIGAFKDTRKPVTTFRRT